MQEDRKQNNGGGQHHFFLPDFWGLKEYAHINVVLFNCAHEERFLRVMASWRIILFSCDQLSGGNGRPGRYNGGIEEG